MSEESGTEMLARMAQVEEARGILNGLDEMIRSDPLGGFTHETAKAARDLIHKLDASLAGAERRAEQYQANLQRYQVTVGRMLTEKGWLERRIGKVRSTLRHIARGQIEKTWSAAADVLADDSAALRRRRKAGK